MNSDEEYVSTPLKARGKYSSPSKFNPKSPVQKAHEKEIERITDLWEGTQDELKKTGKEIKQIEEAQRLRTERKDREHSEEVRRYKSTVDDLRDQIAFTKAQLQKSSSEKVNLELQLKDKDEKLKRTESLLEIKTSQVRTKEGKIQELAEELQSLSLEKEDALNKSLHELKDQQTKLRSVELELKQKEEDLYALSEINKKNVNLISELEELREIRASKKTSNITLEDKIEQLKADNARLTKLLADTGLYNEFFDHSTSFNGVNYLPPTKMDSDEESEASVTYSTDTVDPKSEWNFWIPTEADELAKRFQRRHFPELKEEIFAEFLIKLNSIWHKKEKYVVQKLKAKHLEELRGLRKEMSSQQLEEGVKNLEKIESLKKDLRKAKSPLRTRDLETSVENLSQELREIRRENRQLRRSSLGASDEEFIKGAVWMGRKVNEIADKMAEQISSMAQDYQHKIIVESARSTSSPHKLVNTQGTFLKGLEKSVLGFRDKMKKLFDKVVEALDEGKDRVSVKFETSQITEDEI